MRLVSSASMRCQLTPKPTANVSETRHEALGFTLIVLMSDLTAWKRPSQLSSYSVTSPNGAFTPRPTLHCGLIGMTAYRFGTTLRLPASPSLPPSGWNKAGCEPSSLNLNDGVMKCTAAATCGDPSRDIPAGFDQSVLASSAAAAPPANALPTALPEFSCSANAAPHACVADSANNAAPTAEAMRVILPASNLVPDVPFVPAPRCIECLPSI